MQINLSLPRLPIQEQWDKLKKTLESNPLAKRISPIYDTYCRPLIGRVFGNWRESLMIAGMAFAVIGIASAFFTGSLFYCVCFGVAALASTYGIYYMRNQATLNELKDSIESLKTTKERFETIAKDLHIENLLLQSTNKELIATSESLKSTNGQLQLTNEQLRKQVVELSIISQNLRDAAQEIKDQVAAFSTHNTTFDACLKNLEYQLSASKTLSDETSKFLSQEKKGLEEKLKELAALLQEIKANKPTVEKITELSHVQQKLSQLKEESALERGKLEAVRIQFQDEHSKLQEIRVAFSVEQQKLELLRRAFEQTLSQTRTNTWQQKPQGVSA